MLMMMSPRKKLLAGLAALAVIIGIGVGVWYTASGAHTSGFPLNGKDKISSWNFKGAYTGDATLVAQAKADETKLTGLLGKGQYDDYDLYIGLGNDENLLGSGKSAYGYYNKAIAVHADKGLAYANLGHLFDELGAYESAADAYGKAVAVEPGQLEFHLERLNFLTTRFPKDNARLLAAFTDSANQFGDVAEVLAIEARWLTSEGRYADAIAAWQRAKLISPGKDTTAIDAEIARLKAKL